MAAIDIGGWDMHTNLGNVDGGDMRNHLNELAGALGAFATDLGPQLDDVTDRDDERVRPAGRGQNGNAGTDHGHGGADAAARRRPRTAARCTASGRAWPRARSTTATSPAPTTTATCWPRCSRTLQRPGSAAIFPDHQFKTLGVFKG